MGAIESASDGAQSSVASLPPDAANTQRLYRVRYDGPEGDGGLRLILRLVDAGRFSVAASDTFGRAVWSLYLADAETQIVDHRLGEFCTTGADVRVPEVALATLPVETLPLVLLGRLPVSAEGAVERQAGAGEIEIVEGPERRWTARMDGDRPLSWTFWRGDRPTLWWLAQPRGGILSHPAGSQFRWREGAVEALTPGAEVLRPPDGYPRVDCDAWALPQLRQDQPPPPGDRSPR